MAALTILFAQGQTPCDSITVTGSQNQLTLTSISIIDYWITTAPDGTVLGEDSLWNQHSVFNYNPTGSPYDTILTCLFTMNTTCCLTYVWNGNAWTVPGGNPTPSWDCPTNSPGGCYDPGTGNGQYSSLAACQAACGAPLPSWDCDPSGVVGCFDPGTGTGQYTTLAACQAACSTTFNLLCDSITVSGSQTQLTMQVNNLNFIIDYWISTAPDGTVLGQDSMWNSHLVYNSITNDTIYTCINYNPNGNSFLTCCVTWIWDANSGLWAKMGSVTSIGEIGSFDKKLIKVVDVLGRETSINSDQTLFFIYEDGTIEKRYIIDIK
ncbi:hypothetical protein OAC83_01275 [Flavobacteriales bacterium]|nr:hypothetical protein [Flavobacteriales bacterium]